MFQKIRRNFIIIAMLSVSFVVLLSLTIVNVVNFNKYIHEADNVTQQILNRIPDTTNDNEFEDNRYFVFDYYDNDFKQVEWKIGSISLSDAKVMAANVRKSGKTIGTYNTFRYRVKEDRYVFLDITHQKEDAYRVMRISIYSSIGGLVVIFLLIFFGSKIVLKPVKESYDKQKQFITNASHELKTPLTIISANNELQEMNKGKTEYSEIISSQVTRMKNIIRNLVDFSKMSESTKNGAKTNIDLSSLLNTKIDNYELACKDININVTRHIEPNITIKENLEVITQMLYLIFDNARKYSLTNIDFSLRKVRGSVIFKECNDAKAINNTDLIHFTDRFYRGESSKISEEGGSGVGLSVLKEMCENTNTKLKIYGEDNKFNIELIF